VPISARDRRSRRPESGVAAITDDCTFETTLRPTATQRRLGVIAAFFRRLFDTANQRTFDVEEIITVDDRMVMR
jgi:hypothetical protein